MPAEVKISEDVLVRHLQGETVLLDLRSQHYFGLDEVGTRIWQLLVEHRETRAVVDAVVAEFDVERPRAESDLDDFLSRLEDAELVAVVPSEVARSEVARSEEEAKTVRRKLRSFLDLSPLERRRLLRAFAALARVSLGLRLLGYARCLRWLDRPRAPSGPPAGGGSEALELARGYARAVAVAAGNVPFRARCLERSLALWWLLRRRRIHADLRIGVRKVPDLEAHAWVELDGRAINDHDDVGRRYAAFDRSGVPAVRRPGGPAPRPAPRRAGARPAG